jgi:hypothetical protein
MQGWKLKLELEIKWKDNLNILKIILLFDQFVVLFNHNRTPFQKFNHGFRFKGPSRPPWVSLGQFLTMKISWFRFLILSLNHLLVMMTLATLQINFILIFDPTMLKIWWTRKETWGHCIAWFAHQIIAFSIFVGHIDKHQYNCNSFFKVDMITSSFDIIYPKKSHHFQLPLINLLLL